MTKWSSTTNSSMGGVEYVCAGNRIKTTIKPIQGSYQSKTEITSSNILKVCWEDFLAPLLFCKSMAM